MGIEKIGIGPAAASVNDIIYLNRPEQQFDHVECMVAIEEAGFWGPVMSRSAETLILYHLAYPHLLKSNK